MIPLTYFSRSQPAAWIARVRDHADYRHAGYETAWATYNYAGATVIGNGSGGGGRHAQMCGDGFGGSRLGNGYGDGRGNPDEMS